MSDAAISELLAKDAIREVIYRYSRGLDRMDKPMAYSVWHDDGTAEYFGFFKGTGHGFVDWAWKAHEGFESHSHQMTNILIEVDGERATSETYSVVTMRRLPDETGKQQHIDVRGRYLDRWSKREGRWAIDHRIHVMDMQTVGGKPTKANKESRRDERDPSHALFRQRPT